MLPKHRPPTHPGEMLLKEFLEAVGVTQAGAAKRIGVPFQRLNAIVRGMRAASADTAIRLEALTLMDATFWLRLQRDWDLWHALRARLRPASSEAARRIRLSRRRVEPSRTIAISVNPQANGLRGGPLAELGPQ
jgi:antitoxin HigA-1